MLTSLNIQILVCSLALTQLLSCGKSERDTEVTLEGTNPPVFGLSGSGKLSDLIIYGPRQREAGGDRAFAVWEIKPIGGRGEAQSLESIGKIKYGILPKDYVQIYPENGAAAPPLIEGERYEYWFQTLNAPHARSYFEIRNGKPVAVTQ